MDILKKKFKHYKIKIGAYRSRIDYYSDEISFSLYYGKYLAQIRIFMSDEKTVEYHSYTDEALRGKGLNQVLRREFHYLLEGTGLVLKQCAMNPISDHLLVKFGVPRTPEFDDYMKKNKDLSYEEVIKIFPSGLTHEKQF